MVQPRSTNTMASVPLRARQAVCGIDDSLPSPALPLVPTKARRAFRASRTASLRKISRAEHGQVRNTEMPSKGGGVEVGLAAESRQPRDGTVREGRSQGNRGP